MNLYDLHTDSTSLHGYDRADMEVPAVFWEKYGNKPEELKKREKYIAKSAEYAYKYARDVLKAPFPAGEAAISKNAEYAYYYAHSVLKERFLEAEAVLAKHPNFAYAYAINAIKGRFMAAEEAISKSEYAQYYYHPEGERDAIINL